MNRAIVVISNLALVCVLLAGAPPAYGEAPGESGEAPGDETGAAEAPEEPPLIAEAKELIARHTGLTTKARELTDQSLLAEGEDRLIMERQIIELKLEYLKLVGQLVDNLLAQERAGLDASDLRRTTEAEFGDLGPAIVRHIQESEERLRKMRANREGVEVAQLVSFEHEIATEELWLTTLYRAYVEHSQRLATLGMDTSGGATSAGSAQRRHLRSPSTL